MTRALLLGFGLFGILAVALAPYARDAWAERRMRAEQERQERVIAAKEKEIECLERLAASGLPREMDVEAEIERCRSFGANPEAMPR